MTEKAFRILIIAVGLGIALACALDVTAQDQATSQGPGLLLAAGRKGAAEPPRYRVFALNRIPAQQGKKYLTDAKIGTVSQLPGTNMLLVSAQRRDLNKASAILKLVDSSEQYVVKTVTAASQVQILPSNEQIAESVGDIAIGTFSNPPANKTKNNAIIDVHDGAVMVIAPAGQLEKIVAAIEELKEPATVKASDSEPPKPGTEELSGPSAIRPLPEPNSAHALAEAEVNRLEAASSELAGRTVATDPNSDRLFNDLFLSLAEAEKELAEQTEPTSEISKAIESVLEVNQPKEPGPDTTTESKTRPEPNTIAPAREPKILTTPSLIPSLTRQSSLQTAAEPNIPLVTNMFYDTSLRQALSDISAQTGVIIVPDMTVTGMVTCELQDVPLDKALEIVLAGGGYIVKKMDGYYLVGSPDPKSPTFSTLSVSQTIKLNYLQAEDAKELLPEAFADYVKVNKNRNEVCITAPRDVAEKILSSLKDADKPPRQVMLEARVVELTADAKEQLGVDWSWEWQGHSPGENIRTGNIAFNKTDTAIAIGYLPTAEFTKSLLLMLALLCEDNSATIVANPRVTAMDRQQAQIEVATEEYFKITTGPAHYAYAALETIKSGIILQMTPKIGTSDEITLEVSPEVSDVVGVGAEGLPKVTRRKATTTVRVKNGGTVVIGGLVNNTTQDTSNRVPLLGDVPLLGGLFKSTTATQKTRDVLIFITPRLLGEDGRPEPITTAVDDARVPELVEPAGEEFKKQLLEVLTP